MDFNELEVTNKILKYEDFDKVVINEDNYNELIKKYETFVYESSLSQICSSEILYYRYNIIYPFFVQDFYFLFYISLILLRHFYRNNSDIICLGESPNRIHFIQSLFYKDPITKRMLVESELYVNDLEFKFLPLSGLSRYLNPIKDYITDKKKSSVDRAMEFILNELADVNDDFNKYESYLKSLGYDAKNIVDRNRNFILVDRVESNRTAYSLLYIYSLMYIKLTPNEKKIFISKFKLVGFDTKYGLDNELMKFYIINFISLVFNINIDKASLMYDFKEIPVLSDKFRAIEKKFNIDIGSSVSDAFAMNIINIFMISDRMISFTSLTEFQNNVRCVKQNEISEESNIKDFPTEETFKQPNIDKKNAFKNAGNNCNLINYVLFGVFKRLIDKEKPKIKKLITKLSDINFIEITTGDYDFIDVTKFNETNIISKKMIEETGKENILCNNQVYKNKAELYIKTLLSNTHKSIFNKTATFELPFTKKSYKYKYIKYKNKYLKLKDYFSV